MRADIRSIHTTALDDVGCDHRVWARVRAWFNMVASVAYGGGVMNLLGLREGGPASTQRQPVPPILRSLAEEGASAVGRRALRQLPDGRSTAVRAQCAR